MRYLQEAQLNIHEVIFKDGSSPLHYLYELNESWDRNKFSSGGTMGLIQFFVKDSPKNYIDEHGFSYFHAACMCSDEMVQRFVDEGVDVNLDTWKYSPLHMAAQYRRKEVVQILLKNGADPNQLDREMSTPVHALVRRCLCECGSAFIFCDYRRPVEEIVHMLIQKGANIEARNRDGNTPLQLAVSRLDVDLTKALLEHGASIESLNNDRMFSWNFESIELKNFPLTLNIIEAATTTRIRNPFQFESTRICRIRIFIKNIDQLLKSSARSSAIAITHSVIQDAIAHALRGLGTREVLTFVAHALAVAGRLSSPWSRIAPRPARAVGPCTRHPRIKRQSVAAHKSMRGDPARETASRVPTIKPVRRRTRESKSYVPHSPAPFGATRSRHKLTPDATSMWSSQRPKTISPRCSHSRGSQERIGHVINSSPLLQNIRWHHAFRDTQTWAAAEHQRACQLNCCGVLSSAHLICITGSATRGATAIEKLKAAIAAAAAAAQASYLHDYKHTQTAACFLGVASRINKLRSSLRVHSATFDISIASSTELHTDPAGRDNSRPTVDFEIRTRARVEFVAARSSTISYPLYMDIVVVRDVVRKHATPIVSNCYDCYYIEYSNEDDQRREIVISIRYCDGAAIERLAVQ
ncbi:unnamed protein product [Trichogramma brassicae]|uniref:Uncharacterized protein n=1 Tax=Trichogramma brassicae TaxID=86971 RepID=A0A6H5IFN3_9HYME|nr:unnamed protein product [Trichogramma brassicae]